MAYLVKKKKKRGGGTLKLAVWLGCSTNITHKSTTIAHGTLERFTLIGRSDTSGSRKVTEADISQSRHNFSPLKCHSVATKQTKELYLIYFIEDDRCLCKVFLHFSVYTIRALSDSRATSVEQW